MNREIKFRAWDLTNKSMIDNYAKTGMFGEMYVTSFHSSTYSDQGVPELVLLQFTGMLDKNEKEIYEGDIVNIPSGITSVFFERGCFYTPLNGSRYRLGGWGNEIQIIGNIYENPELITK